jgi:hypothetical protein
MRRFKFSISTLAFAIALFAIDVTLVRYLFIHDRSLMVTVRCGLLMANVLAVAGYRLWATRGAEQPFLGGFVVFGLMAALLYQAGRGLAPKMMDDHQAGLAFPVALAIRRVLPADFPSLRNGAQHARVLFYAATIPAIALVVGFPQLLFALVGGFICSRTPIDHCLTATPWPAPPHVDMWKR